VGCRKLKNEEAVALRCVTAPMEEEEEEDKEEEEFNGI
jgi:hypothetical protein